MTPGALASRTEEHPRTADRVGGGTLLLGGLLAAWTLFQIGVLLRLQAFLAARGATDRLGAALAEDAGEAHELLEGLRPALEAEGLDGLAGWLYAPLSFSVSTVLAFSGAALVVSSFPGGLRGRRLVAVLVVAGLACLVFVPPSVWPVEFAFADAVSE